MRVLAPVLACLAFASVAPGQTGTLDQQSPFQNSSYNAALAGWSWQQEVECGIDGELEGVMLSLQTWIAGDTVTVHLRPGRVWNTGTPLWTGQAGPTQLNVWERVFVDMSAANLQFLAGDVFTIEIEADSQGIGFQGNALSSVGYPHPFFVNGAPVGSVDRMGFETYVFGGGGGTLATSGACPGTIVFDVAGVTPLGQVAFVYGTPGSHTVGSGACAGLVLDVQAPTLGLTTQADANGAVSFPYQVPMAGCGLVVQAVDVATCTPTNFVVL